MGFSQFPFEFIDARQVVPDTPSDLPALRLRSRDSSGQSVRLCAVGDIGLSGRAMKTARRDGGARLFAEVTAVLKAADITFGNLESPLAGDIARGGNFAAPATGAITLRDAGFSLIHLANNHVGEYGRAGLSVTVQAVEAAGIQPLGVGRSMTTARELVRTDRAGLRIGWLGCGRTLLKQDGAGECYWEFDEEELTASVVEAGQRVDILIVSIHIGLMYLSYPRPEHKAMAERLMAAGADLILMHHAHVLQGAEITAEGDMCCFNLGNFLYDWEEGNVRMPVVLDEQNEGAIFLFELDRAGVSEFALFPTWIDDDCCARWATGERGLRILRRFDKISRALEGDFASEFERQRAMRNTEGIVKVLAFHARHGNWRFMSDALRRMRWEHVKMAARWIAKRSSSEV